MRLIDADNLQFNGRNYNKSQMKAIFNFIDSQPTAYDPEKVVKQLEEFQGELELFGCSSILPDMIDVVACGEVDG